METTGSAIVVHRDFEPTTPAHAVSICELMNHGYLATSIPDVAMSP